MNIIIDLLNEIKAKCHNAPRCAECPFFIDKTGYEERDCVFGQNDNFAPPEEWQIDRIDPDFLKKGEEFL